MENMNLNIVPDVDLMAKAQIKLHEKGLDLTTEINKYLKTIIDDFTEEKAENKNQPEIKLLRFEDMPPEERERRLKIINKKGLLSEAMGVLKGMIWMADDFDEPLECLKDYMP